MMPLVITPGVGYREGFEDSADRLADLGLEQQMKVIGHEAIAEEAKRITFLGVGEGFKEGNAVGVVAKDVGAVEGMIDETVIDGAREASPDLKHNDSRESNLEK
jgi:hypothetical protein